MESLQLETGSNVPPLELPYDKWGAMVTSSWLKSTWEFMHKHDIRLDLSLPKFPMRRESDKCLMMVFVNEGASANKLYSLNRCRLYLRAISLADIIEADGKTVSKEAWEGTRLQTLRDIIDQLRGDQGRHSGVYGDPS